jgi:hypothetical protein
MDMFNLSGKVALVTAPPKAWEWQSPNPSATPERHW